MNIRTDLVSERHEMHTENVEGADTDRRSFGEAELELIKVKTDSAAQTLEKPKGRYYTLRFSPLESMLDYDDIRRALLYAFEMICPEKRDNVMIVGLGNSDITPDALGPRTADGIFATRHINNELMRELGLKNLARVSAVKPGVLGKTGIEAADAVKAQCGVVKPDLIIVIDALAARRSERLCRTVQMSDTGITAGSGVGNSRTAINEESLGVPVVAVGIPTVIDAATYRFDCGGENNGERLFVTPKDIDRQIELSAGILSETLNEFLQPSLDRETINALL